MTQSRQIRACLEARQRRNTVIIGTKYHSYTRSNHGSVIAAVSVTVLLALVLIFELAAHERTGNGS